jgi:hypothetical protein
VELVGDAGEGLFGRGGFHPKLGKSKPRRGKLPAIMRTLKDGCRATLAAAKRKAALEVQGDARPSFLRRAAADEERAY